MPPLDEVSSYLQSAGARPERKTMSRATMNKTPACGWSVRRAALCSLGFALLFTQPGQGQALNAPKFFTNYFLTGDYVVAGVGFKGTGGPNGFSTRTINLSGVPANATA